MAKQIREFPVKAMSVMSNIVPDSMATRYFGLEASSSKYLGARHQYVSEGSVVFAVENSVSFNSIFICIYIYIFGKPRAVW